MTSKRTLFPLLILFIFSISCKKNDISDEIDKKEQAEITYKAFLEEQIAQLPEISAPTTEHLSFQKINVKLKFNDGPLSEYPLTYTYYPEGKIKSISEGGSMLYNFAYDKNLLTIQKGENIELLRLDDNGKALGPQIEFKDIDYYYKNDFFISTSENFSIDKTYSANGNLLTFKQKDITGKFEYTDLPNNIRQEVLSPQTFHLSFRDLYLGKFNTNLIKKAEFNLAGENSILDFSYEFDSNNRPIKVTINRNAESGKAVITYELIY